MPKSRPVIVVRLSALGDIALAVPEVCAAARACPDTPFLMLTSAAGAQLFIDSPSNLAVMPLNVKELTPAAIARLWFKELHPMRPRMVIDLHNVIRTRILSFFALLSGVRVVTMSKNRRERKMLTRPKNKVMRRLTPVAERYRDTLARALRIDSIIPNHLKNPISSHPHPLIAVAPFAAHPQKEYPLPLMERAIRLMIDGGARIELFGSPSSEREMRVMRRWERKYPEVGTHALTLSLSDQIRYLSTLDCMVAMDSANMHLAALAAVPTVSVWGPTHPFCGFANHASDRDIMLQADLPCRPCSAYGKTPCRFADLRCMTSIKPETIADAALKICR